MEEHVSSLKIWCHCFFAILLRHRGQLILQKKIDNPDGQVREAREMEQRYKDECERYHDELTQIDHLIQKVSLSKSKNND